LWREGGREGGRREVVEKVEKVEVEKEEKKPTMRDSVSFSLSLLSSLRTCQGRLPARATDAEGQGHASVRGRGSER